ncbi:MAG: LCP family protein [Candidatus Saccharibacteria bacterium]|nr:LCP family protein [Candidatus Saccharibacteria bacterium]
MSEFTERDFIEKEPIKKNGNWKGVGALLVTAQVITSILFLVSLITMNIISGALITLTIAVLIVLFGFSVIKLLLQNKVSNITKIICGIISVICIAGTIMAFRYTNAFNGFVNKITSQKEMKEYSVMVMEDTGITEIKGLADKSLGFLRTDEKVGNAEQHLQTLIKFAPEFYDDVETLTGVLTSKIVSGIVLETDRLEMVKEDAADSIKGTRVIYTFEIELESENAEIVEKQVTKEPFILYISGTDSRAGVKATARSDVNIVAVVNPKKGKILLVSIPRDTYVQLHGTTGIRDKLTHAGVYGIDMSKTTIEDFLGINIDYTAKVSFDTVVKVVDQLDGVEINSDKEMDLKPEGKDKTCHYVVGKQQVDGDCALRFARERKSYERGDRHRGENQMEVITAIVNKLSSSRNYLLRLPEILNIAADSFETSLTRDNITSFIRMQLNDGTKWEVESISIDGAGSMQGTYSMGANRPLYVMLAYPESVETAKAKIQEYLVNE